MMEEGYIKYTSIFSKAYLPNPQLLSDVLRVRQTLHRLKWVGVLPDGIGYGNISIRLKEAPGFLISGTQTGHYPALTSEQFAMVTRVNIATNVLHCTGLVEASSEAMSHAAIYEVRPDVACVIHIHEAAMWQALQYKCPTTAPDIAYGTPAMAYALQELVLDMEDMNELIITAGHQDGVFAIGDSPDAALQTLINWSEACK